MAGLSDMYIDNHRGECVVSITMSGESSELSNVHTINSSDTTTRYNIVLQY